MSQRAAPGTDSAVSLAELPSALGYALRRAQLQVFADFQRCLASTHLRPAQYGVLVVIGANPGVNQSAVCRMLGFKQANLVALINELVKHKLAERRRSAQDSRSSALHLTALGEQLLKMARRLQQKHEQRLKQLLGEAGRTKLLELLALLASSGSTARQNPTT
jgi:DNA-binding MarR family transcriptional regulator